jgi:DNA polymerase (family 10)
MQISTIEELETACRQNRIAATKGFGEKTEQKILESLVFAKSSKGRFYYKHLEDFTQALQLRLETKFPTEKFVITGEFRRQMEIISQLEWVTTASKDKLEAFLVNDDAVLVSGTEDRLVIRAGQQVDLVFHLASENEFAAQLFATSASEEFLAAWKSSFTTKEGGTEEEFFTKNGLHFIPPYLRERSSILERAKHESFDGIVQTGTIKGLIHSHSNWSDGAYTIEEMAGELINKGFEYLVISDHSKAAFYANGLSEEKIKQQHQYIDDLNTKYAPFKIFKSIECDILGDGSLDYDNDTLSTFDLVITSVHSNLDMDEDKAMTRLMGAITNPYTTILGHMTGRLLLKRKGYPVDHKMIIDACAKHQVVIEINAAPSRLDIDWRWIEYALEKGVLLSINPDAHALEEFNYIKYGTLVAQKGALPASHNLSSFSLKEFEAYLAETKKNKLKSRN